jgi:hypothetical protein
MNLERIEVNMPPTWKSRSRRRGVERLISREPASSATPPRCDLDIARGHEHIIHMKRTTLMLDEQLVKEATRATGGSTISGTVNLALRDFVRRARARRILELAGTG